MKLYWDIENQTLVTGVNDPQPVTRLSVVLRDRVDVELRTVRKAGSGSNIYEAVDLAAGRSVYFGAKLASALDAAHSIVAAVWTRTDTGVYTAVWNIGQENLVSQVGSSSEVTLLGEFTQVDEAGDNYGSTQFDVVVKPDVTRGTETPVAALYAGCLVVQVVEDGQKVILIQNTDGVVYQRLTAPGV
jgi:hypothetical protein